ncbi:Mitosis protein dim1-like protein 2 [Colletotrichum chlorophyti]|uniref:Mitosis protein dim1-like protein 2 n=1 Tax=Colletotrichum chlorophyti TaxID=708187 RepID=A0A1Q8RTF2_9PEZI|nr:Mitosis protein dim1-like protein 2 [Colletotrichum chlorophyti]
MGSVVLPHLNSGWHVDQAILSGRVIFLVLNLCRTVFNLLTLRTEEDRLVVIGFRRDQDQDCMRQDEVLYKIADRVKSFPAIYLCDIDQLNWVLEDKQELIDILETVFRGARKGRGLVVSPKDYSTRHRY